MHQIHTLHQYKIKSYTLMCFYLQRTLCKRANVAFTFSLFFSSFCRTFLPSFTDSPSPSHRVTAHNVYAFDVIFYWTIGSNDRHWLLLYTSQTIAYSNMIQQKLNINIIAVPDGCNLYTNTNTINIPLHPMDANKTRTPIVPGWHTNRWSIWNSNTYDICIED